MGHTPTPAFHDLIGNLAIGDAPSNLAWLEHNYNNRARVPTAQAQLAQWASRSEHTRAVYLAQQRCTLDIAYGPSGGETLDVFMPHSRLNSGGKPRRSDALKPVVVFIHGGYWRGLDKADHSMLAPALERAVADKTNNGALVVMPNYDLCPSVEIGDIALQMTRAMAWVYQHIHLFGGDANHVSVVGHSAGGHLATMMLACSWQHVQTDAGEHLPKHWIRRAVSLSGLYDLAPLVNAPFIQDDLRLTPQTVSRCSPAYWPKPAKGKLFTAVGSDETDEFVRHNTMMREAWGSKRVPVAEVLHGLNHFSIIEALADQRQDLLDVVRHLLD